MVAGSIEKTRTADHPKSDIISNNAYLTAHDPHGRLIVPSVPGTHLLAIGTADSSHGHLLAHGWLIDGCWLIDGG